LIDRTAAKAPFATYVNPFSKCFIGLMFYDSPTVRIQFGHGPSKIP
jgi:hypothetical protein